MDLIDYREFAGSLIHRKSQICVGVKFGAYCVIDEVVIGKNTVIDHHVCLKDKTEIGKNCKIESYVKT